METKPLIMSSSEDTIQQLNNEINEITEKYNQLQISISVQQEKIQNIELRKRTLQSMVEKAKSSRLAVSERLNQMKDNETKKKEKIRFISEEIRKEISKKILETTIATNRKKELYKVLKMKCEILKQKKNEKEMIYTKEIAEIDQNLLLIKAKQNEVLERIKVLRNIGMKSENSDDKTFDIKYLQERLLENEAFLHKLEEECRALHEKRDQKKKQ